MADFCYILWCIFNSNVLDQNETASQTSNLFFLVPPVSALMAWLFLEEIITYYDILGLIISTLGVYIATRDKKN